MKRAIFTLTVMSLLIGTAGAATHNIVADDHDQLWYADGASIWAGQDSAWVGYNGSHIETAYIVPFQLPDIGTDSISSANLVIGASDSEWGAVINGDLYGVRVASSATTAFSDFYAGAWDDSGTYGAAIQQAYVVKTYGNPAPANPRTVNNDAAGATALAAWIQSLYDGGAQAGDYAFLRINPDQDYVTGSNSYVYMYTADSTDPGDIRGGTTLQLPTLTIETSSVPEPATMMLMAAGLPVLLKRRRKRS